MARDINGNYSLPASGAGWTNPVISGTTISPAWANVTLADIANELSDSLSRSGKGGLTAPFKLLDGSIGSPSLTFANETTTGFYRAAAGDMRAVVLGVEGARFSSTSAMFMLPVVSTRASGQDAIWLATSGARLHLGAGTTDYLYSDGSAVVAAGLLRAMSGVFVGSSGAGSLFAGVVTPGAASTHLELRSQAPNTAAGKGLMFTNQTALSVAGSRIATFYSDVGSTERAWIGYDGSANFNGTVTAAGFKLAAGLIDAYQGVQGGAGLGLALYGRAADGATAVGVTIGTASGLTYANASAKLASFVNGDVEKAHVKQTGQGSFYGLDAQSQVVANVAAPVANGDAANKGYVDPGMFLASGAVNGTTGAHIATKGRITVTPARTAAGTYTLTVSGLTANAIVLVNCNANASRAATVVPAAGVATVYTYQTGGASLADCNFTYSIIAL